MPETDADLIEKVSYAWKNSCVERVPAIGSQIAKRLTEELQCFPTLYHNDEEAFMVTVKHICASYTLTRNQMRSLTRSLNADFYRIITQRGQGMPEMPPSKSGFDSFDNLMSALDQGGAKLEAILAGQAQAPDIDALFQLTPDPRQQIFIPAEGDLVTPSKPPELKIMPNFDPVEQTRRMGELMNRRYRRWEEVKNIFDTQEIAHNLRLSALAKMLEQARLSGCYSGVTSSPSA